MHCLSSGNRLEFSCLCVGRHLDRKSTRAADNNNGCFPSRCARKLTPYQRGGPGTPPETCQLLLCFPVYVPKLSPESPTYAANGQREAYSVEHRGGDGAVVEGVLDAVIATEKAPLIRAHFTQVKGCQRQTPCGWRDWEEEEVKGGQKDQNRNSIES